MVAGSEEAKIFKSKEMNAMALMKWHSLSGFDSLMS